MSDAPASTPQESFERIAALRALGATPDVSIPGTTLDAVAYRVLLGSEDPGALAPYQTHGGGFTFTLEGDEAEPLPTALALAAVRA